MKIQYAKFASLVLPFYAMGRIPIYPFDINNGISVGDEQCNVFYHYHPAVMPVQFQNIGFSVVHYADNDSRILCCLSCDDEVYGMAPDILTDAVEMGMAAWGGKVMTADEALRLARYLQPSRQYQQMRRVGLEEQTVRITIPEITLDVDGILTRGDATEEVLT